MRPPALVIAASYSFLPLMTAWRSFWPLFSKYQQLVKIALNDRMAVDWHAKLYPISLRECSHTAQPVAFASEVVSARCLRCRAGVALRLLALAASSEAVKPRVMNDRRPLLPLR